MCSIELEKLLSQIQANIAAIQANLLNRENLFNNGHSFIQEYFLEIRLNIDLFAEQAIKQIKESRQDLITQLNDVEHQCVANIPSIKAANSTNQISNRQYVIPNCCDSNKDQMVQLNSQIIADKKLTKESIQSFKNVLLMRKNYIFLQKRQEPPDYLFGSLLTTDFHTDPIENDLVSLISSTQIIGVKVHYYDELVENVYDTYPELKLKDKLQSSLESTGLSRPVISALVTNSEFDNWPSAIRSLKFSKRSSDHQRFKDENLRNLRPIVCMCISLMFFFLYNTNITCYVLLNLSW